MERPRWLVSGDWDGFLGLFFSGLPDLLLIVGLGPLCGLPQRLMVTRILPGIALSVLGGNVFYSWQAWRLAARTGRGDVTAIPFGVNAPTIFAYIFLVMAPVYRASHDANLAWQVGVFACLISGVVQTLGAFTTGWLRRAAPRAALLCPLAGLALAFLCLDFIFSVFQSPATGVLPMLVLFALYAGRIRLPWRIPAPLAALALGAVLTLANHHWRVGIPANATLPLGLYPPHISNAFALLRSPLGWQYLTIIFPMSLIDTVVSLQILESVRLEGDNYPTRSSLLVNGIATLAAALFGSPFPTTLYFGHISHKRNGARIGYSALSGLLTATLCVTGLLPLLLYIVPLDVAAAVIIWFGLLTIGQAFSEVSAEDTVAVALGLIPMIAQWALELVSTAVRVAGSTMVAVAPRFGSDLAIYGLSALGQGSLLISMVWAASLSYMFARRLLLAAAWLLAGAALSFVGLIHAAVITEAGVQGRIGWNAAPVFTLVYSAAAGCMVLLWSYDRTAADTSPGPSPDHSN